MALLKTVSPDEASGKVKEAYDLMKERAGVVPKPLQMYSASPGITEIIVNSIQYLGNHDSLSPSLLAYIRMLVAQNKAYPYCIAFNAGALQMLDSLSDEQIEAILKDPSNASLDDKDLAMLLFVIKTIDDPDSVNKNDIDKLHGLGWTDQDIFDACHQGVSVVGHGILFKAFKMDR